MHSLIYYLLYFFHRNLPKMFGFFMSEFFFLFSFFPFLAMIVYDALGFIFKTCRKKRIKVCSLILIYGLVKFVKTSKFFPH